MIPLLVLLFCIIGLLMGWFSNFIITFFLNDKTEFKFERKCSHCGTKFSFKNTIPILSLFYRKCKVCQKNVSVRYTFVEILHEVSYLFVATTFIQQNLFMALLYMLTISVLIIIAVINYNAMSNYSFLVLLLLLIGLICLIVNQSGMQEHIAGFLLSSIIGICIFLASCTFKAGNILDFNNIKLFAICGLIVGWKSILFAYVLCLSLSILLLIVLKLLKSKKRNVYVSFISLFCISVIVSIFIGDIVLNAYLLLF